VTRSIEGQVAAILTGTVLALHFAQFQSFTVTVHPVNQSGASSREVADIDIKQNGEMFVAVEVKDKPFTDQDIDHAAFKAGHYGLKTITLIMGTKGKYVGSSLNQATAKVLAKRGVTVICVDILPFIRSIITLLPNLTFSEFLVQVRQCAHQARVKDAVLEHLAAVTKSM
jgi:SacI restriction endonuclease